MTDQEIDQQLLLIGYLYPDLFMGYMALNYKAGHHLESFQHINTISELTFMQMHGLICPKWQYVPLKALNMPFMPDAVIANLRIPHSPEGDLIIKIASLIIW